jgi:mandelamide amidase
MGSVAAATTLALHRPLSGGRASAAGSPSLTRLTATEALSGMKAHEFTASAYVAALLKRRDELGHLNAFISQSPEAMLAAAAVADERLDAGDETRPLLGLPIAAKDNIDTSDLPTTGGTPALEDWTPPDNAKVFQALLDAGALLAGKTNMHELALGLTSNNARFGAVRNPYDDGLIAGGSSGGTAAAVAARLAPVGLGTDTGGSVRIPAALCGVVGFRPTLDRYSQAGVIPLSHTRDTIGPIARSVADIALLDEVCANAALEAFDKPLEEIRIGVPATYFYDNLDFELEAVVAKALERFRGEGIQLIDVDIENVQALNESIAFPIVLFEVLRELSAYLYRHGNPMSVPDLVDRIAGADVKGLLQSLMGDNAVPAGLYREVLTAGRPALQRAYAGYFEENNLDAMVVPTTPLPARPIGEDDTVDLNGEQVPTFMTYIRNTDPPSNAGLPCLSVPAGLTSSGLPVGVEFVGPAGGDAAVLHIGALFEAVTGPLPAPGI